VQGEPRPDLHVLAGAARLDNIRAIHGPAVARELLPLEAAAGGDVGPGVALDAPLAYRLSVRDWLAGWLAGWLGRLRWRRLLRALMSQAGLHLALRRAQQRGCP
jgi:hypothetical protein